MSMQLRRLSRRSLVQVQLYWPIWGLHPPSHEKKQKKIIYIPQKLVAAHGFSSNYWLLSQLSRVLNLRSVWLSCFILSPLLHTIQTLSWCFKSISSRGSEWRRNNVGPLLQNSLKMNDRSDKTRRLHFKVGQLVRYSLRYLRSNSIQIACKCIFCPQTHCSVWSCVRHLGFSTDNSQCNPCKP